MVADLSVTLVGMNIKGIALQLSSILTYCIASVELLSGVIFMFISVKI